MSTVPLRLPSCCSQPVSSLCMSPESLTVRLPTVASPARLMYPKPLPDKCQCVSASDPQAYTYFFNSVLDLLIPCPKKEQIPWEAGGISARCYRDLMIGLGPGLGDSGQSASKRTLLWIGCWAISLIGCLNSSYLEGKKNRVRLKL